MRWIHVSGAARLFASKGLIALGVLIAIGSTPAQQLGKHQWYTSPEVPTPPSPANGCGFAVYCESNPRDPNHPPENLDDKRIFQPDYVGRVDVPIPSAGQPWSTPRPWIGTALKFPG